MVLIDFSFGYLTNYLFAISKRVRITSGVHSFRFAKNASEQGLIQINELSQTGTHKISFHSWF